jgi:putative dehydrogenase
MDPAQARTIGERVEASGRAFVDAPTSGGTARAAEGALTLLTSGRDDAMKRAEPIFDAIASKVYRLGAEAGAGSAFKMINQLLAGVHIAAACEGIAFAKKLGLDLSKVYEVITASAGNSWMFENRVPHILENDYAPKSAVAIFTKDLGIVSDTYDGGVRNGAGRRCFCRSPLCEDRGRRARRDCGHSQLHLTRKALARGRSREAKS